MLEQQERKREAAVAGIRLGGLITLLVGVALLLHGFVIGSRSLTGPANARR